jgi:hypothetical protein
MAVRQGLGGCALLAVWLRLLLHLASHHAGVKHAPHQLLTGASSGGVGLADPVAESPYAQQLDEVIIVQIQFRLAPAEHCVYGVAEPFGAFLFVHLGVALLPWL